MAASRRDKLSESSNLKARLDQLAEKVASLPPGRRQPYLAMLKKKQMVRTKKLTAARLSDTLRVAIEMSGISQARLAKNAGISPALISRFMNAKGDLSFDSASKVARVLGLELKPKRVTSLGASRSHS